jgi:hypothetical protein
MLNVLSVFAVLAMVMTATIKVPSGSTQSSSFHSWEDSHKPTESTTTMNDVKSKPKKNTVTLTVFENPTEKFGIKKAMTARLANVLASNLVLVSLVNINAIKNKKNDATVLNTAMVNQSTPSNVTQPMLVKTSNAPVL